MNEIKNILKKFAPTGLAKPPVKFYFKTKKNIFTLFVFRLVHLCSNLFNYWNIVTPLVIRNNKPKFMEFLDIFFIYFFFLLNKIEKLNQNFFVLDTNRFCVLKQCLDVIHMTIKLINNWVRKPVHCFMDFDVLCWFVKNKFV